MKETREWSVPLPLVSIALATFNGEKYLRQQLDSLLNQTYKNFEIVISDDNSNDSTLNIIKEYQVRDSRIKFILSRLDRGFINNFQNAILHSVGEIIFYVTKTTFGIQKN
jgi:glycosyltransferase involved in cell wall biosynthesis